MWYNLTILFTVGTALQNAKTNENATASVAMSFIGGFNQTSQKLNIVDPAPPSKVIIQAPLDPSLFAVPPPDHSKLAVIETRLDQNGNATVISTDPHPQILVAGQTPKKTENPATSVLKSNISKAIKAGMSALMNASKTTPKPVETATIKIGIETW